MNVENKEEELIYPEEEEVSAEGLKPNLIEHPQSIRGGDIYALGLVPNFCYTSPCGLHPI